MSRSDRNARALLVFALVFAILMFAYVASTYCGPPHA